MIALFLGTALAVTSLLFVLYPLFRAEPAQIRRVARPVPVMQSTSAVDALRELEFDQQTGKISASDYESLKARYTEQAVAVMRAGNAPVCERCGPRPESDAQYCSNCGAALVT
jgi:ribosomal protein L40E